MNTGNYYLIVMTTEGITISDVTEITPLTRDMTLAQYMLEGSEHEAQNLRCKYAKTVQRVRFMAGQNPHQHHRAYILGTSVNVTVRDLETWADHDHATFQKILDNHGINLLNGDRVYGSDNFTTIIDENKQARKIYEN